MKFPLILLALAGASSPLHAGLSDQLTAYYDFEATGTAGLANKAPGATTYNATRNGGGDFDSSANPSGPGFAGMDTFTSTTGTSTRNALLAGKALNLVDDRNDSIQVPLGTAQLGNSFTVSAWHYLAPASGSTKTRFHVFETSDNGVYDVSWGTTASSKVNYIGYIATGAGLPALTASGLAVNAWHHTAHVFTSDGTTTTLTIYVDGVKLGSGSAATSLMSFASLNFGRARNDTTDDRDWDGMLDEIGIWSRPLAASEVQEIYARGQAGFTVNTDLATQGKAYVSVVPSDPTFGSVTGSGLYNIGDTPSIIVFPNSGYAFYNWSGGFPGESSIFSPTLTASVYATANLGQDTADDDGDGLTNYQELKVYLTNPSIADTDGDGISDGDEVKYAGTSPTVSNAAAINYANSHFVGQAGDIKVGTPTLTRDAGGGVILKVPVSGSTDHVLFTPIPLDPTKIYNVGTEVEIVVPAPSSSLPVYKLLIQGH